MYSSRNGIVPANSRGSAPVTHQEDNRGNQEINSQIGLLHFIEPVARAHSRQKIECAAGDENVQSQKR
jgi:hypothetical protein